jgi:hypothetical protein
VSLVIITFPVAIYLFSALRFSTLSAVMVVAAGLLAGIQIANTRPAIQDCIIYATSKSLFIVPP